MHYSSLTLLIPTSIGNAEMSHELFTRYLHKYNSCRCSLPTFPVCQHTSLRNEGDTKADRRRKDWFCHSRRLHTMVSQNVVPPDRADRIGHEKRISAHVNKRLTNPVVLRKCVNRAIIGTVIRTTNDGIDSNVYRKC
jgi:hypothetical protein